MEGLENQMHVLQDKMVDAMKQVGRWADGQAGSSRTVLGRTCCKRRTCLAPRSWNTPPPLLPNAPLRMHEC